MLFNQKCIRLQIEHENKPELMRRKESIGNLSEVHQGIMRLMNLIITLIHKSCTESNYS